ncbi:MAG TPA: hypothetical protein VMU36_11115, partial [Spirochaetia bacterium]|nr:hypothetical protein [Spirochaetia bacterium]
MTALAPRRSVPFVYLLLGLACILYLMPVYVLVITSLKSFQEVSLATMWRFPTRFSLESFSRAWSGAYQGLTG